MQALGIDIGGTGIKGAPVDLETGKLLADRKKIATPHPSTPEAVTDVVRELAGSFPQSGEIVGATFPGVVISGQQSPGRLRGNPEAGRRHLAREGH